MAVDIDTFNFEEPPSAPSSQQQKTARGRSGLAAGLRWRPSMHLFRYTSSLQAQGLLPSQLVNHGTQFAQAQGWAEDYRNNSERKRMSAARKANLHFCAQSSGCAHAPATALISAGGVPPEVQRGKHLHDDKHLCPFPHLCPPA
jgi:hypothetical protein